MSDAVDRLNAVLSPRYRLERKLGEGGMATVFLAEDLRHKRQVAIKVLTPAVAAALGAGRFLAEIETTAGLHHPHILPLFDSGEADGFLYYVMPHVKGETLRDRLEREGQLPVDEAVTLAEKVAGAPQAAHDAGIVHRDVKPSNILISKGEPLVADFGIALAVQAGGAQRLTETGLRVGTTHYMSPEQAAGDETVGPRTDVFALGCVVFEMLVGHPPFQASTPHAVLAKILTGGAPRTSAERASVPPHVEAAIAKALETVPSDRFRSAGAFAAALRNPAFRHPAPDHGGREGPGRAPAWKVLSEVLAVAVIAAGWMAFRSTSAARDAPLPSFRIPMRFPQEQALAGTGHFDLSSDGSVLVYQGVGEEGRTRLWVRRGDAEEASPIQGAAGLSASIVPDIALSPSGERVGFWKGRDYQVVSTAGGVPRVVADSVWGVARWSKDGEWLYLRRFGHPGISRVPARGGEPEVVTRPNTAAGISGHVWPDPLEGGEGLVLEGRGEEGSRILVVNLETGETRDLGPGRYPRYADGWLLYGTEDRNRLLAAPFDPGSLELTGSPRTLLDDIAAWGPSLAGAMAFAVSQTGVLVYAPEWDWDGLWMTSDGASRPADPNWTFDGDAPPAASELSPVGDRVALALGSSGEYDVWVKELDTGPLTRVTSRPGTEVPVAWRGRDTIVYQTGGETGRDLWTVPADGSAPPSLLHDDSLDMAQVALDPSGRRGVLLTPDRWTGDGYRGRDVHLFQLGEPDSTERVLETEGYAVGAPTVSPDGAWLAYVSTETDRDEVVVRSFPDLSERRMQVSVVGGSDPTWGPDGSTLFYVNGNRRLIRARIGTGEGGVVRTPLFTVPQDLALNTLLSPQGRFFVLRSRPELLVFFNWAEMAEAGGN